MNKCGNNDSSQWLADNFEHGVVEESKELGNPEEQSSSASSSLSGNTIIAPCAAASTTTYIRCNDREAPRAKLATQTTPATAEHNIVKARMVYKPPKQTRPQLRLNIPPRETDAEELERYNKRSASPPTTNNITLT